MTREAGHGHAASPRRTGADPGVDPQASPGGSTRRRLLAVCGALFLAAPWPGWAQPKHRPRRVGFLAIGARPPSIEAHALGGFLRGMRELGYVEGRDYIVEWRFAEGRNEDFERHATELARLNVEVMIAATGVGIAAARRATQSIPIVMVAMADPVRAGFVKTLARPGGSITGLSNQSTDIVSKHPELLRAAIPGLKHAAVMYNPEGFGLSFLKQVQNAAATIGLGIRPVQISRAADVEAAFAAFAREWPGGIIVTPNALLSAQGKRIAELATAQRLPTLFWTREHAEAGALMSYGQDNAEHYYRAAAYVDKIFKGAKPGELPVEMATKIELVINLRTARAIGLDIPPQLLFRADRVIE